MRTVVSVELAIVYDVLRACGGQVSSLEELLAIMPMHSATRSHRELLRECVWQLVEEGLVTEAPSGKLRLVELDLAFAQPSMRSHIALNRGTSSECKRREDYVHTLTEMICRSRPGTTYDEARAMLIRSEGHREGDSSVVKSQAERSWFNRVLDRIGL